MALYDDYFTNEDKPFAENLNDALLLSNVFDMTVPIEFPKMFSNSTWVSTTSPRKCGVAVLTLKEGLPSGVTVGTDSTTGNSTLTGTGTVELSFYPNFNSFGKFKSMTWENTGTIVVNLKTTTGTTIASNISKGNIENQSSELRTLQEIVIEIVFTNATLKSFEVVMENKQATRYGATVGISDVTGLDDTITAIQGKNTEQDNRISDLEGVDAQILTYDLYSSNYNPNINSNVTISCRVKRVTGEDVEGATLTLYKNGSSVGSATTSELGVANWTVNCSEWGIQHFSVKNQSIDIRVTGYIQTSVNNGMYTIYEYEDRVGLRIHIDNPINFTTGIKVINDWAVPHRLAPRYPVMQICANGITATASTSIGVRESNGTNKTEIICKSLTGSDVSREAYAYLEWDKKY